MRLNCLKRDSRFKIQDLRCEKILIPHSQPSALSPQPFENGFTLVEIAMVLVVVGVLVVFGITLIGPLAKRVKYNETKATIQAAIDGVEGWSYAGGPSGEKILPPSGTGTGTFGGIVRNPNDAWLAQLYYVYDNNLTAVSTGGICGRSSTAICLNVACTGTASDTYVAFAVLSAADDHIVQTTLNSITIAASGAGTGPLATPSTSDDIVYWVTLNELRTKAGCKGAQLQILNQELPDAIQNKTYNSDIYAEGGVPFSNNPDTYKWCTTTAAPAVLSYTCTTPLSASATCSLTLGTWLQCSSLTISGSINAPAPGIAPASTATLTFYVKDNDNNITNKTLLLTIKKDPCPIITIVNNTGGAVYYKQNGGTCTTLNNTASVSSVVSDSTAFYTNVACGTLACTQTYDVFNVKDTNNNCSVSLTAITPSCTLADN